MRVSCFSEYFLKENLSRVDLDDQPNVIAVEEARRFMIDCFLQAKVPEKHAKGRFCSFYLRKFKANRILSVKNGENAWLFIQN